MYNHKKQLLVTFALGIIVGAGALKVANDNGIFSRKNYVSSGSRDVSTNPRTSRYAPTPNTHHFEKPKQTRYQDPESFGDQSLTASGLDTTPIKPDQYCELQELMSSVGSYRGTVDGISGPQTRAAIKAIQERFNLPKTGVASVGLLNQLRATLRRDRSNGNSSSASIPPRPVSGEIITATNNRRIAPLTIVTTAGTGDYAIKLENASTGKEDLMFFVRGGKPAEVRVPLGNYVLKYANGTTWLSKRCLFGRKTSYNKADKTFEFSQSGRRIAGYTVELILQRDGNLETRHLSKKDW